MRLDAYIVLKNPNISRSRAKALIEGGSVKLDGKQVIKPSVSVDDSVEHTLEISVSDIPYVSRGGFKLAGALDAFKLDVTDLICADIGASTGGFTDCLLQRGARRVYAVDSGTDQLASSLRADDRVISMENFNARDMTSETFGEACQLAVADLSFISQTLVLEAIYSILSENGVYIGLIKPQFECGRSALNKNGIVKDKKQHMYAIKRVISAARDVGFYVSDLTTSSIHGGDGNTEFLFMCQKSADSNLPEISDKNITDVVNGGTA